MTTALTIIALALGATVANLGALRQSPQISLEHYRALQAFKQDSDGGNQIATSKVEEVSNSQMEI